jgi:hypothetical protein
MIWKLFVCELLLTLLTTRTCLPQVNRRRLWPRPGQEALAARENGKERHAQHGTRWKRENGSCCKSSSKYLRRTAKVPVT